MTLHDVGRLIRGKTECGLARFAVVDWTAALERLEVEILLHREPLICGSDTADALHSKSADCALVRIPVMWACGGAKRRWLYFTVVRLPT
jgi:hypothetical protein